MVESGLSNVSCFHSAGGMGCKTAFCQLSVCIESRHDQTNNVAVRPAKTQISLGILPVWPESSLCAQWVAKDPSFLHADSEGSDQTGQRPRMIWDFAGCTDHFVGFFMQQLNRYLLFSLKLHISALSEFFNAKHALMQLRNYSQNVL